MSYEVPSDARRDRKTRIEIDRNRNLAKFSPTYSTQASEAGIGSPVGGAGATGPRLGGLVMNPEIHFVCIEISWTSGTGDLKIGDLVDTDFNAWQGKFLSLSSGTSTAGRGVFEPQNTTVFSGGDAQTLSVSGGWSATYTTGTDDNDRIVMQSASAIVEDITGADPTISTIVGAKNDGQFTTLKPIETKTLTMTSGGNIDTTLNVTVEDDTYSILQFFEDNVTPDADGSWSISGVSGGGSGGVGSWKAPVRLATTANITLSGEQSIDGFTTDTDRVLVKNQTAGEDNGIYLSAAGAWARASDFNISEEVVAGVAMMVEEGTINEDKMYVLTTDNIILLDTTSLTFENIGAGLVLAGTAENDHLEWDNTGLQWIAQQFLEFQTGVADVGDIRFKNNSINLAWRNNANNANYEIKVETNDILDLTRNQNIPVSMQLRSQGTPNQQFVFTMNAGAGAAASITSSTATDMDIGASNIARFNATGLDMNNLNFRFVVDIVMADQGSPASKIIWDAGEDSDTYFSDDETTADRINVTAGGNTFFSWVAGTPNIFGVPSGQVAELEMSTNDIQSVDRLKFSATGNTGAPASATDHVIFLDGTDDMTFNSQSVDKFQYTFLNQTAMFLSWEDGTPPSGRPILELVTTSTTASHVPLITLYKDNSVISGVPNGAVQFFQNTSGPLQSLTSQLVGTAFNASPTFEGTFEIDCAEAGTSPTAYIKCNDSGNNNTRFFKDIDVDGNFIILDVDGDSNFQTSVDDRLILNLGGVPDFIWTGLSYDIAAKFQQFSQIASPNDPPSDGIRLFAKTVGGSTHLFQLEEDSTETDLTLGGGGDGNASGIHTKVVKKVDDVVNNSTTFRNDSELFFTGEANKVYSWTLMLRLNSPAIAGLKKTWTVPSGATGVRISDGFNWHHGSFPSPMKDITSSLTFNTLGIEEQSQIHGNVQMGSTSGLVRFRYAQGTAQSTDSKILKGSTLLVYEEGSTISNPIDNLTHTKVVKSADQIVSNTTFTNDTELKFEGAANKTYNFMLMMYVDSSAVADIKTIWTLPSGATGRNIRGAWTTAKAEDSGDITVSDQVDTTGGTEEIISYQGKIDMGSSSGTCQFQWAQNFNSGSTTVNKGSALIVYEQGTSTAAGTAGLVSEQIVKPVDQIVNNSIVLINDDHIFFTVDANTTYSFRLDLWNFAPSSGSGGDFDSNWSLPSGATGRTVAQNIQAQFPQNTVDMTVKRNRGGTSGGNPQYAQIFGVVTVGSTPGIVQFRWAQGTADTVDTKVLAGTTLTVWKA